jgi:probable HAF family extracellular repeat protein
MKTTTRRKTVMSRQWVTKAAQMRSVFLMAVCAGLALTQALAEPEAYKVYALDSLGGTSSRGDGINDRGGVAGYSNLPGDMSRHAVEWRRGRMRDLGTLGGPNSSVVFGVEDNKGLVVGISQTATPDTSGEIWSSGYFYPGPNNTGFVNLGFVCEHGQMRGLPTLGGIHGFAAGVNNRGQAVGWAENTCQDGTCVPPQIYQFRPVHWDLKDGDRIGEFPLFAPDDTSGAAVAINDAGQAVGITGICDQAIGRYTAKHAVLWEKGSVIDLGNLGAEFWNTPTAINRSGTVVGFAGDPAYPEGDILHGFIWTKQTGIQPLPPLPNQTPEHVDSEPYGLNDQGQAVGISCDADFSDCRGVVWENGEPHDLNDPDNTGFVGKIDQAFDINNAGEITGRGIDPNTSEKIGIVAVPAH